MTQYDVVSICNALVDVLVTAEDSDLSQLELTKGMMHLVDEDRQAKVLSHFSGKGTTTELGGSAMNAIRTIASLGLKTSFAGMIGEDSYGRLIKERMESLGIDSHLASCEQATGTCLVLVTPDGERTMNTNLGASCLYDESLVPEDAIKAARIFHFCGYQWDAPPQIRAIEKACDIAKEAGSLISFDVADPFVIGRHKEAFLEVIKNKSDIVFSNKEEARMLFDCPPDEAAQKIAAFGAIGVVKKGSEGAVVSRGHDLVQIAPVNTDVVDTTAAGDMFAAGFLYGLAKGKELSVCGKLGASLASDVISRVGASVSEKGLQTARSILEE